MDLLLRHASVVDGTGGPARAAEVAIDGDRIAAVAPPGELVPDAGTQVVDLDGLTLAPGFIDIHTHYDAQILWDGDLTPSSWHGVTSVVMGNCGFGVAPTRPEHRETIVRTLRERGGHVDGRPRPGHRLVLRDVPRVPGRRRPASQAPQRGCLRRSLHPPAVRRRRRGAAGDRGRGRHDVRHPPRGRAGGRHRVLHVALAEPTRARSAARFPAGSRTSARWPRSHPCSASWARAWWRSPSGPGLWLDQFSELSVDHGVPVTWTALLAKAEKPGAALRTIDRGAALPGEVYPQMACRPIVMQITMADPTPLGQVDEWKEVLALPRERRARSLPRPGVARPGPPGHARRLEPPVVEDRRRGDRARTATSWASHSTGWPRSGARRRSTSCSTWPWPTS